MVQSLILLTQLQVIQSNLFLRPPPASVETPTCPYAPLLWPSVPHSPGATLAALPPFALSPNSPTQKRTTGRLIKAYYMSCSSAARCGLHRL